MIRSSPVMKHNSSRSRCIPSSPQVLTAHSRLLIIAGLTVIILVQLWGGGQWIQQNEVLLDRDAGGNLQTSLQYRWFLQHDIPSLAFYKSLTYSDAPTLSLIVQPFYHVLGVRLDSSLFASLALFACSIVLVFVLAVQIASWKVGLFAALLTSLLPIMVGLSRTVYPELPLTVALLLYLITLYRSQGFQAREWAYWAGAILGFGLLTDWIFIVLVTAPTIWVVRSSPRQKGELHSGAVFHSTILVFIKSLLMGALIGWLIYWPNRTFAMSQGGGDWILGGWSLLGAFFVFAASLPRSARNNFLTTVSLGVFVASLHYLPNIHTGLVAATDLWRTMVQGAVWERFQPLSFIPEAMWGLLAFWLIVPAALAPWIVLKLQRRSLLRQAAPLWLAVVSGFFVLPLVTTVDERILAPLAPLATILFAIGLAWYPFWGRRLLGASWLVVLALQWSLFTFNLPSPFDLSSQWLVQSAYITPANRGVADSRFNMIPRVLQAIAEHGVGGVQSLGVLVDTRQLYADAFRNEAVFRGMDLVVHDATEKDEEAWLKSMASQWLVITERDNDTAPETARRISVELLQNHPPFASLYDFVERYSLPDGNKIYLFHRPLGPGHPLIDQERVEATRQPAAFLKNNLRAQDTLIYTSSDLAVWVGMHEVDHRRTMILDRAEASLADILDDATGVWCVVSDVGATDLIDTISRATNAYHAFAADSPFAGIDVYGFSAESLKEIGTQPAWADLTLATVMTKQEIAAGDVLPLDVQWIGSLNSDRKASFRLLAESGEAIASNDRILMDRDRFGLFVPTSTTPGQYLLAALVYDAETFEPIPDSSGNLFSSIAVIDVH